MQAFARDAETKVGLRLENGKKKELIVLQTFYKAKSKYFMFHYYDSGRKNVVMKCSIL